MSQPRKRKSYVRTVVFMVMLTMVSISAVSALHLATADIVRQNESLYKKSAVLQAAGREIPTEREALLAVFDESAVLVETGTDDYYRLNEPSSGQTTGYVLIRQGAGLWGTVQLAVGLGADRQTLLGIAVLKQNETPGLGARIGEEWFQKQFNGKGWKEGQPLVFVAERTRSSERNEFDAITGATITTKAVRDILNRTIKEAPQVLEPAPAGRSE